MRISNQAIYDTVTHNLAHVSDAMLHANQVVSTGKRINRLSDDPVGLVSVLNLRSSLDYIAQLERNIAMGDSWLAMGETALAQVEEVLSQAKTLTIQMANDTQGAEERASAAVEVEGYFHQVLSLANTQVDGRYIFSGTQTATAPFAWGIDAFGNQGILYQGNDTEFEINIAKGINVAVGRDGTDIFGDHVFDWNDPDEGTDNIFKTLLDLKGHLESNDRDGIQTAMGELDSHMDNLRTRIADTGAKMNRLELKSNIIQDLRLTYTDRKSELEDADIAEAIMDLKAKELAYQAALNSSAKVMKMSLVDFL